MARRTDNRIITEDGLSIVTEDNNNLVIESWVAAGGGHGISRGTRPANPSARDIARDTSELWEVGASISTINHISIRDRIYIKKFLVEENDINVSNASIYSINDTAYKDKVNIRKYISEGNNIKITISEDIILRKPKIINENVTVTLLSTRIKE